MNFIKKLFIKNYQKTKDPVVRNKYGKVAGILGILSNIILFIIKIIIGLISGSITIVVDAVNNLTDAGNSIITLLGFKLSSKPADKEHPFGHARLEYITGLIVSLVTFAVGVLFAKSCIEKIISPVELTINIPLYITLTIAIIIKVLQMIMYFDFAKSIDSDTLKANGVDARNDIITTSTVLLSMIVMNIFSINIDGYVGLLVSLFVIYSSIKMVKETINPLISEKPHQALVKKIKKELLSFDGVDDIHDLLIHSYGSFTTFVSVHIEVPSTSNIIDVHNLIDKIVRHFADTHNINITIQADPIDRETPKTKRIYKKVKETIKSIDSKLSIHSLRVVYNPNCIIVLFDILEDFKTNLIKKNVENILIQAFADENELYEFVFSIDKPYI